MAVETRTIHVSSREGMDVFDITEAVQKEIERGKIRDGIVTVFVKGSTAALSTIEYEPNLLKDFENAMERVAPSGISYEHDKTWGDKNGKSHIRAAIMGPSLTVPFTGRKLILGTWQQIGLFDFDVPARKREIVLQIVGD